MNLVTEKKNVETRHQRVTTFRDISVGIPTIFFSKTRLLHEKTSSSQHNGNGLFTIGAYKFAKEVNEKMVAKEQHELKAGTIADSLSSVGNPSDSGQEANSSQHIRKNSSQNIKSLKYVTVESIDKEQIQQRSKVQKKRNSSGKSYFNRLPVAKSPNRQVKRRLSDSPKKKTAISSVGGGTRSEVFMEPPGRKSGLKQSLDRKDSQSTWQTRATISSSLRTASVSGTLSRVTRAHPMAPAPTKSLSSNQRILKISGKISALIHSPSGDSINTRTGFRKPYYVKRATPSSSIMSSGSEILVSTKTAAPMKLKLNGASRQSVTSRSRDRGFWKPKATTQSYRPRTPKKVSAVALGKARDSPSPIDGINTGKEVQNPGKNEASTGGKKEEKKKEKNKKPPTPSTEASGTTNSATSRVSKKSKKIKGSESNGKRDKRGKEKPKKLNRKVIYKDLKGIEKRMEEEAKNRKKMEWEKHKLFFYWNCVVTRLHDLQRRNHSLKKKEASLKMEKRDGMFHQNWKSMNLARLQREECLDQKRAEFRSMIRELRDSHKRQTDWLFKEIQTYVKDTYLVGQTYVNDVVGIRMEYTKGLTDTIFEARENMRVLEIEQNSKYRPALEEFEEQMQKLRSKIPTERQERLQKMLAESNGMLVELVNVYTTILHHNFIEVCHTANIINELKSVERRLEREMNDMAKKRDKIKERTEYLHERVSNLRRQVNSGKEARKKLHRVMKDQEVLQNKIDLAYINKEMTYQENSKLALALQETSERVDRWYFKVKRDFIRDIILEAAKHEERASQLMNYNHLVKYLFNVESDFLETIENFKDHEEFDDQQEGLKVLLGVYRPHTIYDLEREFEGCTESFTTAIIFFKRRLQQHFMSLDDLHFFIKRRNPLSYLNKVRKEELELKQMMASTLGSQYAVNNKRQHGQSSMVVASSSQSFRW